MDISNPNSSLYTENFETSDVEEKSIFSRLLSKLGVSSVLPNGDWDW